VNEILKIIEEELISADIKIDRARSSGLDYEGEYWSGQRDALRYIEYKIGLLNRIASTHESYVPELPDDEIFNPYDKGGY